MGYEQSIGAQQAQQQGYVSPYQQNYSIGSPYAMGDPNMAMAQTMANAPIGLLGGTPQQASPVASAAQAAGLPQGTPAAPQQAEAPKKRGFFGTIARMAHPKNLFNLAKGATVGLVKSVIHSLKDWKTYVMIGLGVALMFVPIPGLAQAAGAALIAYGVAQAGMGAAKSGMQAYQAYSQGYDDMGDKAIEDVGTNMGAMALSVAGARGLVKSGAVSTSFTKEAGWTTRTRARIQGESKVPVQDKVIARRTTNNGFTQSLADTVYVTRYGMNKSGKLFSGWKNADGKWFANDNANWVAIKDARSTVAKAAEENGGGVSGYVKGFVKTGWDVNKTGMAAELQAREKQQLEGNRAPLTGISNEQRIGLSNNDLLAAWNKGGTQRLDSVGSGQLAYTRPAIEAELRQRGFVPVTEAGDGIWARASKRVRGNKNDIKQATEWQQRADVATKYEASKVAELKNNLETETKALKKDQDKLADAKTNNSPTDTIDASITSIQDRIDAIKSDLSKELQKGDNKALAQGYAREIEQPRQEAARMYASLDDQRVQLETRRNKINDEELTKLRDEYTNSHSYPTIKSLTDACETAQKQLTKARNDKSNLADDAAKQAAQKEIDDAQAVVADLKKARSQEEIQAEITAKETAVKDIDKQIGELDSRSAVAKDPHVLTEGQKIINDRKQVQALQAKRAVEGNAVDSALESYGKLKDTDATLARTNKEIEDVRQPNIGEKVEPKTLIRNYPKIREFYAQLLDYQRKGTALTDSERANLSKLYKKAGLGDELPANILENQVVSNVGSLQGTLQNQIFALLDDSQKAALLSQIKKYAPTATEAQTKSYLFDDGRIFTAADAELLTSSQTSFAKSMGTDSLGHKTLDKLGLGSGTGIGAASNAGVFSGNAFDGALQNLMASQQPYSMAAPMQQLPYQSISSGDAYIRPSDISALTGGQQNQSPMMPGMGMQQNLA